MFQRVYDASAVVAESDKFQVKIYLHPNEGGGWHVHIVRKSDQTDVKIGLWDFELKRPTKFRRATVKAFQVWVFENRHFLRKKWMQKVVNPRNRRKCHGQS
ncbi:MAG: DUF4160 domain-containing protein [Bdellovibrionales bacterium]|nr:DUF4160 domain-containing protein [Bdellovibrionales bacterium]